MVRSMYLPAALHGIEASLLASDSLRKLRSSIHRVVWSRRQPLASIGAVLSLYQDVEFFDYGGGSWVRQWLPSWGGFVYWLIDPEGAGMGLSRRFSGTCCAGVWMMLVRVAPFGAVKEGQTERGLLAPVHGGFGRIQVCRVARFALGTMDVILRRPCI